MWRVEVLIKPTFGALEVFFFDESTSQLELFAISTYYEVTSSGLKSRSEMGCIIGMSTGVNVLIVKKPISIFRGH